jgi:omega-hydroxy-beta-dihydromenaquinone-9 sulfotransferase
MMDPQQDSSTNRLRLSLGAWRSLARRIDPSLSRLSWRTRSLYWLDGAMQSTLQRIQNKVYSEALAATIPQAPVFVLGFWRCGTTFLHELLCCDSRFGFPTTYACLNPAHFLLSERWIPASQQEQARRPMDDMYYSWSSPQEDEFALLALGASSAYQALLVPSLMKDAGPLLDLQQLPTNDQDAWCRTFDYFLKLLTIQQGKPMVLKSPTHGYRMRTLQNKFPEARYVIIERNPYEIFASNLKLWRTLTGRYGLELCSEAELEKFIFAAYILYEKAVSEGVDCSTSGSVARLRYEDLVAHPVEEISRVYLELRLGDFSAARPSVEAYLSKTSGHRRNRFRLSRAQKMDIDAAWGGIIEQKGYSWPGSHIDLNDGEPVLRAS